jgi:hypothetical protein
MSEEIVKPDRFAAARAAKAAKSKKAEEAPAPASLSERALSKMTIPKRPPVKWGPINTAQAAKRELPAPGIYDANIYEVKLYGSGDTLWLAIHYALESWAGDIGPELAPLAAQEGSAFANRTDEGARLLFRTADAAGVELPEDLDPEELPDLLEGKRVKVKVAHKKIDGVMGLIARRAIKA